MSGIYSQLGVVKEVGTPATITGITFTAGAPNIGTVAAAAHGHRVGDVVTLTGFTPAGWNGTFVIMSVPTSGTYVISTGTTVVANASVMGTETITKYGGGGTPSRFFEIPAGGEGFKYDRGRVESSAVTTGRQTKRADRFAVYGKGGAGALKLEVLSKGFAYWLDLMLGTVVQSGPTDTAAFTYTATQGSLLGKSCVVQPGRPYSRSNVVQPFTYPGAKVQSWSLDNTVDGILMLTLTFSFQDELVNVALAAVSFPTGAELLTFVGGNITLGGLTLATVKTIGISCNNNLTPVAERRFINNSGLPGEPFQTGLRDIKWTADCEFEDMTAYNRYRATTAAGTMAALSAGWTAPTLIAGAAATFPSLTVNAPNARNDEPNPNIDGASVIKLKLGGPLLNTAATADDAISLVYVTGDSTA